MQIREINLGKFHLNLKQIANTPASTHNLNRIVEILFDRHMIIDNTICVNVSERISRSKVGCL